MTNVIRILYEGMVASPALHVNVQRRMLAWAVQNGDEQLILALASRDLDPSIDAELAKITTAGVRAAWIARPERTVEEIETALKREKRIGVLEALAARPGLSKPVLDKLSAADNVKVATALLANTSAPLDARRAAVQTWVRANGKTRSAWGHESEARSVLSPFPELHEAAAAAVSAGEPITFAVLTVISSSAVTANNADHIVDVVLDEIARIERSAEKARSAYTHESQVAKLKGVIENVCRSGAITDDHRQRLADRFASAQCRAHTSVQTLLRDVARAVQRTLPRVEPVTLATQATDSADLDSLIQTHLCVQNGGTFGFAAARNPVLSPSSAAKLSSFLQSAGEEVKGELAEVHRGRPDVQGALMHAWYLRDDLLSRTGDPTTVLEEILRARVTARLGLGDVFRSRHMTLDLVKTVPATVLSNAPADLIEDLAGFLLEEFEGNDELWAIFEGILGDDDRSIDNLVLSVKLLACCPAGMEVPCEPQAAGQLSLL